LQLKITLIGSMMYKHEGFEFAKNLLREEKINVKSMKVCGA
jgi:hypothetical protein